MYPQDPNTMPVVPAAGQATLPQAAPLPTPQAMVNPAVAQAYAPAPQQYAQAPLPQMAPPTPAMATAPTPANPLTGAPQPAAQPFVAPFVQPPMQLAPAPATAKQAAKPLPHANPNSTQNTLQIAEIRDGIVIMNDGSFRSVVMVKSINFDLMSAQEQEAVEYSYQGFLNSLYFPVQIFLRSQKVDLQPYIDKLDKIRTEHDNMLLALLMEDYISYIDRLSEQTNIMDKKFYVIIPFFPLADLKQNFTQNATKQSNTFITGLFDMFSKKEQHVTINEADLEAAKTELRNRVQSVLSGLQQCGIQGLPLDTQELIELYYDTYNPDTATRQELKNFNDLTADVIIKGQGMAPQAHLQRELQ